jgi:hypothetical protein
MALLLAGAVLVSGLPFFPTASPLAPHSMFTPSASGSQLSFSNGQLAVQFQGARPAFTVQALSDSRIAMSQTLAGLAEVNSSGGFVALASFAQPGVIWTVTPSSEPSGTRITLAANLAVLGASGNWGAGDDGVEDANQSLGVVHVVVAVYVNSSSSASAWTVAYTLNVSGWPWTGSSDSLGIQVNSSSALAGASWSSGSSSSVVVRAPGSNPPLATYLWGSHARVQYSNGTQSPSPVFASQNASRWTNESFVRLEFGSVQGGYNSLEYDPWITLNPGAFKVPAWAFSTASLEVLGIAAALVLVFAIGAGSRRRHPPPPDL